jgi:thiamine transport system substrate-binding protein
MKKLGLLFMTVILLGVITFSNGLTIYTYESMSWIEDNLVQKFEKKYNTNIRVIKLGDAGGIVSRLILEKRNPKADLVIGLDQSLAVKALEEDLLVPYKSKNLSKIKDKNLLFDKNYYLTPFDYGAIAFIYDPEKIDQELKTFEDLKKMNKSIIIQNPSMSSTAQSLLLWTIAIYGENWKEFWKSFKNSILTVTPGWSESFAKFEAGEAPMMLSYATDGAYSYEYYKQVKYKEFIPEEGGYVQIEAAGIVNKTKNRDLAEKFIDFMLEEEFQKEIPLNNWMFPVINTEMPESFKYAKEPNKILSIDSKQISENLDKWLKEWEEIMY